MKAEKDAPLGYHNGVKVTGTPAKGEPTTQTFDVKVDASQAP